MVNKKNILAFLNYNYMPFSKAQCIKRALMVWAAGAALCLVNQLNSTLLIKVVLTSYGIGSRTHGIQKQVELQDVQFTGHCLGGDFDEICI